MLIAVARPARPDLALGVGLGLLFFVLQAVVTGFGRELRYDEVVYLAQFAPGEPDVDFGPQRARGITLLAAPLAMLRAPTWLLRLYLMGLSSAGVALAFSAWVRSGGAAAWAGAAFFAVSWVPLYFGSELYPNFFVALGCVAATGYLVHWCAGGGRRAVVAASAAVAAVALLRPADAVWLCGSLAVVALGWRGARALRPLLWVAAGAAIGALPWVAEALVRFGGVRQRLDAATSTSVAGTNRNNLIQYLNLIEGPVRRVVADPVLTYRAAVWLVLVALLAATAVLVPRDGIQRAPAVAALVVGLALLLPYLLLNGGINLRYLLPAYGLLSVSVGAGLVAVFARAVDRPIILAALAAGVLVAVSWQGATAHRNGRQIAPLQARPVALASALDRAADGRPCAFLSESQWPEIQWASACVGEALAAHLPTLQCPDASRDMSALADEGRQVFVLARGRPPQLSGWPRVGLGATGGGGWSLWRLPPDLPAGQGPAPAPSAPSPCPPSRAPDTTGARLRLAWGRS